MERIRRRLNATTRVFVDISSNNTVSSDDVGKKVTQLSLLVNKESEK